MNVENTTLHQSSHSTNLVNKFKRLVRFGIWDFFSNVEIETCSKCNRKCSYCPNKVRDRGDFYMNEKLFKHIIDQLKDLSFEGILRPHFYNEPLIDKRLPDLISYVRRQLSKTAVHLYSNGDYLTKPLFKRLIRAGVDKFIITSHDGVMHRNIRNLLATDKEDYLVHQFINEDMPLFNRGGKVEVNNPISLKDGCEVPSENLTINYRGEVVLCCNDAFCDNVFGNLSNEPIAKIWKKKEFVRLRGEIRQGFYRLDVCKKCVS